jgi:hypothetical protein
VRGRGSRSCSAGGRIDRGRPVGMGPPAGLSSPRAEVDSQQVLQAGTAATETRVERIDNERGREVGQGPSRESRSTRHLNIPEPRRSPAQKPGPQGDEPQAHWATGPRHPGDVGVGLWAPGSGGGGGFLESCRARDVVCTLAALHESLVRKAAQRRPRRTPGAFLPCASGPGFRGPLRRSARGWKGRRSRSRSLAKRSKRGTGEHS